MSGSYKKISIASIILFGLGSPTQADGFRCSYGSNHCIDLSDTAIVERLAPHELEHLNAVKKGIAKSPWDATEMLVLFMHYGLEGAAFDLPRMWLAGPADI